MRVAGAYDDSVREAARVAEQRGWAILSDTSWPGYERIPGLVMQGYTAIAREALRELDEPPTHVFVQAGVGGIAAAVAAHFAAVLGERRPVFVVVEPARAACLYESAKARRPVRINHGEPTVMAMLECYEPSLVAWRILARAADAFMTVDEGEAVSVMNRLAHPAGRDPVVVAGESGGVGLAGLIAAVGDPAVSATLGLDGASRVFAINTEGATDPSKYEALVGLSPEDVLAGQGDGEGKAMIMSDDQSTERLLAHACGCWRRSARARRWPAAYGLPPHTPTSLEETLSSPGSKTPVSISRSIELAISSAFGRRRASMNGPRS